MTTARQTKPCSRCGRPVWFVTATTAGGDRATVAMDAAAVAYVREPDGQGGAVWAAWRSDAVAVEHFAVCPKRQQLAGAAT